ncbi:MAG: transketolase [Deltaproteobacteria bacterium]|nr:transketolase [Deltaproteobacteria bacterium]
MSQEDRRLDQLSVSTIRMLAADMVEKANSGHPGMPLGAAPMAYVLWSRFLRHNPADPAWANRDRFILSAGHGSALLYALLHLTGYDLSLDDLKDFRQWESRTPGHPEYGVTPGVECTTGPLGQGFTMGVGMALAERFLAEEFNRPGLDLLDHYTYAIVSDGDLMEGAASEAASLAGALGLGKLIYLYDDNHISIEGGTELTFTENVNMRFEAYGWHTLSVADGNDLEAIAAAITAAQQVTDRPSLIKITTHIGWGTSKVDSPSCHGEPLGAQCLLDSRKAIAWPEEPFHLPVEVKAHLGRARERGARAQQAWQDLAAKFEAADPAAAARFQEQMAGRLPADWDAEVPGFAAADGSLATRAASGKVLNGLAKRVPNLVGGSADLAPSTKTVIAGSPDLRPGQPAGGRNLRFGVRELGMTGVVNGMALHGGVLPYGATFFVFSDFMRPALRLAALQGCHAIFVLTHDSIGVGEDGPTHQPVEQLMSLRLMPGLTILRPADANETAAAWKTALLRQGPTVLVLSRQGLPILDPATHPVAAGVPRGGYVLADCEGAPEVLLVGTGSEVHLCLGAQAELAGLGIRARVVSLPSFELFYEQDQAYRDQVLPPVVTARVAVEAGVTLGWERIVGDHGAIIGLDRFGASAPGKVVQAELGFTVANVTAKARQVLGR